MPTNGSTKTPQPIALEQIAAANQRSLAAATQLNAKMMAEMLKMNQRILGFASRRLRTDMDTATALTKCGAVPDILAVAQNFCAQAMSDYAEETNEMLRLGAEITAATIETATTAAQNAKA
jgi:hypothetical protein